MVDSGPLIFFKNHLIGYSNDLVVFKSIFWMFLGCEVGRFGANCTLCRGCQSCDIVSGECGTWHLTKKMISISSISQLFFLINH